MISKNVFKKITSLLCAATLGVSLVGCSANTNQGKTIAVVAKGESHAFWQSVRAGAEAAGKKYGYNITFRGPASESAKDLPSQKEMLQTALSNNVQGIVLATIGEGFVGMLEQAYERNIPVVEFDSGVWEADTNTLDSANKNPIISSVATSNYLAAGVASENFYNNIKDDIAKSDSYVVGVIQHDETVTGIDRANGFIDKFKELAESNSETAGKVKIEHEIKPGDADNAYRSALEALYEKGAKAIFMSNEGVVKQVYDAIAGSGNKYDELVFCGYDAGTKQIEWMKKTSGPKLIGSVAQNSYEIGYKAVEEAVNAIEGKEVNGNVDISGAWWNSENVDEMIENKLVYQG